MRHLLAIIISVFMARFALSESKDFEFDVKNLNHEQRDKLFAYLDVNKESILTQNEFDLLLKKLFFSNKLNKPYAIDESDREKLFNFMDFDQNKKVDKEEFNKIWDQWICVILKPESALIVVDMQNDFLADNGSLKIENGVSIVPVINKLIDSIKFNTIVYTYDWHPVNHCSFIDNKNLRPLSCNERLWPKHCVQNTYGAQLYKDLKIANNSFKVYKGMDPEIDSYSAFFDNGRIHKSDLSDKLLAKGITDVYLSGVAYEYCVGSTAIDSLYLGFRTSFIEDAVYAINSQSQQGMRQKLIGLRASLIKSDEIQDMVDAKDRKPEMGFILAQKVYQTNKIK